MKKFQLSIILFLFLFACAHAQNNVQGNNILPKPASVECSGGHFTFDSQIYLKITAPKKDKAILKELIAASPLEVGKKGNKQLVLKVCKDVEGITSPEGYRIETTDKGITVTAKSGAGLFYAMQTILQYAGNGNTIPTGTIIDEPKFAYRGLMLDVSRHFFDKEFIKKQIDAIAHFKMNRLHLHLTDAAGWRIEIKKYPRLTEFAAWRSKALWKDWWFGDRLYVEEGTPEAHSDA